MLFRSEKDGKKGGYIGYVSLADNDICCEGVHHIALGEL